MSVPTNTYVPRLKWLFEAHFTDGSMLQGTYADQSTIDPQKSAFYDVKQRIADVTTFGLFSNEDSNVFAVDLRTGKFSVNGVSFTVEGQHQLPEDTKYRLVYFQRVNQDFNQALVHLGERREFHFGWQTTTADGKNIQQTIAVS